MIRGGRDTEGTTRKNTGRSGVRIIEKRKKKYSYNFLTSLCLNLWYVNFSKIKITSVGISTIIRRIKQFTERRREFKLDSKILYYNSDTGYYFHTNSIFTV